MYEVNHCPCCAAQDCNEQASVLSPFIQEYVFSSEPRSTLCTLLLCRNCGFAFFKERFTEEEARRLYAEYRTEDYFRIRHNHEPWYTQEINKGVGESPETRCALFDNFIGERSKEFRQTGSVLDYGGDRGQYISDLFRQSRKYVFDLSGHEPVPNVTKLQSPSLLQQERFDFVYLCNILEHLSEPQAQLVDVQRMLAPSGYLYIEVPSEYPRFVWFQNNRLYKGYLMFLIRCQACLKLVDVMSLLFRLKLNWPLPPFCLVKLHEHINFFTVQSLSALLLRTGYEVVTISETHHKSTSGRNRLIQCLARASPAAFGNSKGRS